MDETEKRINETTNFFNQFVEKWCGNNKGHLLDTDENDGEKFRGRIKFLCNDVYGFGFVEGKKDIIDVVEKILLKNIKEYPECVDTINLDIQRLKESLK